MELIEWAQLMYNLSTMIFLAMVFNSMHKTFHLPPFFVVVVAWVYALGLSGTYSIVMGWLVR